MFKKVRNRSKQKKERERERERKRDRENKRKEREPIQSSRECVGEWVSERKAEIQKRVMGKSEGKEDVNVLYTKIQSILSL